MNDHPLSNSTQDKTEDLYPSLPHVCDIAHENVPAEAMTKPLSDPLSRFSAAESFTAEEKVMQPVQQKPTETQNQNVSFETMHQSAPIEKDMSSEFAPLRPTPSLLYRTEPTTEPVRPTTSAYMSEPTAAPVRPTPSAYTSEPTAAPVRPTPSAYTSEPTTAPVRPTTPAYAAHPATPSMPSYTARPTPSAAKAKPKKRMGWRIALIALCCALIGSALGGAMVGYYFEHYKTDKSADATAVTQPTIQQQTSNGTSGTPVVSQPTTTLAQLYNDAVPSIVGITNEYTTYYFGQPTTAGATGTGFIISSTGEILTNYHVVENAQKLTVTLHDGTEYSAELLGYEAESDVALLKIDAKDLPAVTLGNSDAIYVGEQIAAIGNPLGELTYTMTVGYVSAKGRAVYTDDMPINMMQIDAAINSGNSGGPLFNLAGEVVGITTAKYSGSISGSANIEGIGFAIPINDVLSILDDLREYGSVQNRAYIGVTVTNSIAGGDIPSGALVQSIERNSSGAKAGLRVNDIITAVGDTTVTGIDTLYQALRPYRGGDTVKLTVFRSGDTIELTITFDATPSSSTQEEEVPTGGFEFPWG